MSKLDPFSQRHDEIREQLELMDAWVEQLPMNDVPERRAVMGRVVDFLKRYVLVDARHEEQHLFPMVGPMASVLLSEHGYIARWVTDLEKLAQSACERADAERFRATAYRLFGLLEAHMHCEETVVAEALRSGATERAAP